MNNRNERFIFLNPQFLPYFLPSKLKSERIFSVSTFSFRKKNVEVEISGFNIMDFQRSINFLTSLENRFGTYDGNSFFERQEFSLCFQSLDLSTKTLLFSKRKRKVEGSLGLFSFLKERDKFFKESTSKNLLLKARLCGLTKGGFISSCFGSSAFLIRSSIFYKLRKQNSYKSWYSLNLSYYGFLSYFSLVSFKKVNLSYSKKYQKFLLPKRFQFYYFNNEVVKYLLLLSKPLHI